MVGECQIWEERSHSFEEISVGTEMGEKTRHRGKSATTGIGACREMMARELEEVRHRQALSMDQMGQEAEVLVCNACGG